MTKHSRVDEESDLFQMFRHALLAQMVLVSQLCNGVIFKKMFSVQAKAFKVPEMGLMINTGTVV